MAINTIIEEEIKMINLIISSVSVSAECMGSVAASLGPSTPDEL